jgi:hypothetical protein
MKIKPVLDDWEIPRVASIHTSERRVFAEFAVPGRVGSLYQDLNTAPTCITITGSLYGDEARDEFLNQLRSKFRAGAPVTFVADIVTATDIQYVVVETLQIHEHGAHPDQAEYRIVLRESPPPPPPPDPLGGLDSGLLDQAGGLLDTVTGALDAIESLGSFASLGDPTPPLRSALDGVKAITTGIDGIVGDLKNLLG